MKDHTISETELWAYLTKTADSSTHQKVENWINSDDFDPEWFAKTTSLYQHIAESKPNVESAKKEFFTRVSDLEKPAFKWSQIFKYAAIFIIVIVGTFSYPFLFPDKHPILIETTFGEEKEIQLSDGSVVWLNASSQLSYDEETPRTLYLKGEAFFEVAKDKTRPFTVTTADDITVKALGTSFNVKSYPQSLITETKLLTGKVEVIHNNNLSNRKLLYPNEKIVFYKNTPKMIKSKMEVYEANIAWREGRIQFKNSSFKGIANELKIKFDVNIRFENEEIARSKFTGTFNKTMPVQQILEILKISNEFDFELDGMSYRL